MKVKDLLNVVDTYYLERINIYTDNYDTLLEWDEWHNNALEKYYNYKVNNFTWYNDDLWICVED